jgi:hypothetical protein
MNIGCLRKAAHLAGLDADARAGVEAAFVANRRVFEAELARGTPIIAALEQRDLERSLGRDQARMLYLLLALAQVPVAWQRHQDLGLPQFVSDATLADLGVWVRHFRQQEQPLGITLEIFAWTQRYLCGDLLRFGIAQFEPRPFPAPLRVFRNAVSRELAAFTTDGRHRVDLRNGDLRSRSATRLGEEWTCVLEPGAPMLELHLPAGVTPTFAELARSARLALTHFTQRSKAVYAGIFGEAWLLDPQLQKLLRVSPFIAELSAACALYPSTLPEAKTVRRLFGPDVNRAMLRSLPRASMTSLQRAIAQHLSAPQAKLQARGGLVLADDLAGLGR